MERPKRRWKHLGWVSVTETFGEGSFVRRDLLLGSSLYHHSTAFNNFNLAFQFLVYGIDKVPEELHGAGTENVGTALVVLAREPEVVHRCE